MFQQAQLAMFVGGKPVRVTVHFTTSVTAMFVNVSAKRGVEQVQHVSRSYVGDVTIFLH